MIVTGTGDRLRRVVATLPRVSDVAAAVASGDQVIDVVITHVVENDVGRTALFGRCGDRRALLVDVSFCCLDDSFGAFAFLLVEALIGTESLCRRRPLGYEPMTRSVAALTWATPERQSRWR